MTQFVATDKQRQTVVERARAQLGKPYEFGSAGPDTYDCSGSVIEAWKPFLPDLPHNSSALVVCPDLHVLQTGRRFRGHWPRHYLLPGDVCFFYGSVAHPNSVSHVAVFIGDGKLINATGIVDGVNRGVEEIHIDAYAHPVGIGFIGHNPLQG